MEDAYAETVIENGAVRSITVSAAVAIQNGSAPQFPDKAVSALQFPDKAVSALTQADG